ncbi:MAG: serine--tRNA ligase [Dehalococcoidia bacterium]
MLNIELVRHQPDSIRRSLERRREDAGMVDRLVELDLKRRELVADNDELRARRNSLSELIGRLMREGKTTEAEEKKEEVRLVGAKSDHIESGLRELDAELRELMLNQPNVLAEDVPDGDGPDGNVVIREEGEQRSYDFPLKPHWELSETLGITDFERGAKLSGRMFYVLGDAGARLQRALVLWMLDLHRQKHGYQERSVPFLVLRDVMEGSGNLPKFGDNLYHDQEDDLWLIPTAEVPLTNLYRDEILEPGVLPLKFMAHTPCFRREKAAAGSQVRGLKRLHQFEKVEMYQFVEPEQSEAALQDLVEHASDVCRGLGLPFRVLQLCTGDISFPSAKSYDIEIWSPASKEWLEVSSCSNCTDFQARRANIRFRREQGARTEFLHTLNGSGLGLPRVLIALLETYQQPDGSVRLPDVLVPYMGGEEVLQPL